MKLSKEVQVGLVSVLALACFIYGFNYLKGINFFATENKFYAVYEDIDGLVEANPLMINGYKVGIVSGIELASDGKIVISMLLDDGINVPVNSVAEVVSSDLLGSKAVKLQLGDAMTYAVDGDTLTSAQQAGLQESVNKIIAPLQKKASDLLSSIDSVMVVVQLVLNKGTRDNISKSFENVNLTLQSLQKTSVRLESLVEEEKVKLSSILTNVDKLATTLADNSDNLSNIIDNFSDISDSLSAAKIKTVVDNANSTLAEVASIMEKINKGEGTIGLLVNDESLYRKLDKSSEDLDKLLIDLKEHPNRYVHVSVFGKKDKTEKEAKKKAKKERKEKKKSL